MTKWDHCDVICDELEMFKESQEDVIRVEKELGEMLKLAEHKINHLNRRTNGKLV